MSVVSEMTTNAYLTELMEKFKKKYGDLFTVYLGNLFICLLKLNLQTFSSLHDFDSIFFSSFAGNSLNFRFRKYANCCSKQLRTSERSPG